MQKQLYIDLDRNLAVNASGNQLAARPVLVLGEQPEYRITFGRMTADQSGETVFTPEDLSSVVTWRLSVDKDFSRATVPMCRSVMADGIDISHAADGVIVVPVDTQTDTFLAAVDGKDYVACWLQLVGWDVSGRQVVFVRLPWSAWGNIDYDGATAVVPQDTLSGSALRAILAAGMILQYSATGGNDAGHSEQAADDRYWRMRASGIDNAAWSDWIAMVPGAAGSDGHDGADGASAYEIAVAHGFEGTEEEWLASLKGAKGDPGTPGAGGNDGHDGESAYEIAVRNGFEGTEAEWLASLQGAAGSNGQNGQNGADGASAYEIAVAHGFSGTEAEWLASLQGAAGADGQDGTDGQDCSATTLTLVRPVSDLALFPVVEASASADFTNAITLDTQGVAADRAYCKVFTGEEWVDIPASGLGTPFDGMTVAVDMSTKFAALAQPYYVRFCWRTAAGADSDWSSIRFPSVSAGGGTTSDDTEGDPNAAKLADDNTFSGNNTFTGAMIRQRGTIDLENPPVADNIEEPMIVFRDKNGTSIAKLRVVQTTTGKLICGLSFYPNIVNNNTEGIFWIAVEPDGTITTAVPTPASTDYSNKIATTEFVKDAIAAAFAAKGL